MSTNVQTHENPEPFRPWASRTGKPKFERAELEEMMQRWLDANVRAEQTGDWISTLGAHYTQDAEYTWNVGPREDFVAQGLTQIHEWALGVQMEGFEGWQYPYDKVLIDDVQGEVVAFWRQIAPWSRADGSRYEVVGVGGSHFRYDGDFKWSWQRDFFDFGNVMALLTELAADGHLPDVVKQKIRAVALGQPLVGHVPQPQAASLLKRAKGQYVLARAALLGR
jgi:hypothetical protein